MKADAIGIGTWASKNIIQKENLTLLNIMLY